MSFDELISVSMLSISTSPLRSVSPVTSKSSPTLRFFAIPTPPATVSAPVAVSVDCVSSVIACAPIKVVVPVTSKLPPTLRFCAIPTPPSTINAPLVVSVDCVVSFKLTAAVTSKVESKVTVSSTFKVPFTVVITVVSAISTPPAPCNVNAPVVVVKLEAAPAFNEISFVESISVSMLSISTSPLRSVSPVTSKSSPTLRFFAIPTPPATVSAPVVVSIDCAVSVIDCAPVTSKVESKVVASLTDNVPSTVVVPVKVGLKWTWSSSSVSTRSCKATSAASLSSSFWSTTSINASKTSSAEEFSA